MSTSVPIMFLKAPPEAAADDLRRHVPAGRAMWGGWGSNPGPADYESDALIHQFPHMR
jgi:hypothetical protein